MSMIKRQLYDLIALKRFMLQKYKDGIMGEEIEQTLHIVNSAMVTIKKQSEKLHAYAMERSSQYYHGGWIPMEECKPQANTSVLLCNGYDGEICLCDISEDGDGVYIDNMNGNDTLDNYVAWMSLPAPYKESD